MQSKVLIYPNPFNELINLSGLQGKGKIQLLTLNGLQVLDLEYNSTELSINIDNLNSGIYIIKIVGDTGVYTQKLIKQ